MKTTPFTKIHQELGAKMLEFAGFNMPVEYSGIKDEHATVRNAVGVFDVSHMGEIWVKGPDALQFLQKVTTNDVSVLSPGMAQYSCFPNAMGGIVDDLVLYHYSVNKYLLVVNAANIQKDWEFLNKYVAGDVKLENGSDHMGQLAIQGPKAIDTLQKLTDIDLKTIPYYSFTEGTIAGIGEVIISNTGYTGSGGFELYFYSAYGVKIWEELFKAGEEFGIKPIGLGARDTLRLEKGYCLYGNDIDDFSSPIEAGLGWITKFVDGKNFIDRAHMEKLKEVGVGRRLRGFKMIDRGIPRKGYEIVAEDEKRIGVVTSGTMSPTLNIGIGLGYIRTEHAKLGNIITIKVRNKLLKAEIVKLPFV